MERVGENTFRHIPSGRVTSIHLECFIGAKAQDALEYVITRRRIEWNRDRLFVKSGRDLALYRTRLARIKNWAKATDRQVLL